MEKSAKIYVAGHRGLVGSALVRRLHASGYKNLILRTHAELDLTDFLATRLFFETEKPDFVFLAAAKVGGINANNSYPAEFIAQNLAIQSSVIQSSYSSGVSRLLFLGSSCIYPRDCPQPIKEEFLLSGSLEATNRPYAIAKIAGIEMCWAYNRQYGTRYLSAMPTNLYGPNDNFDLKNSHVLPALIRKFHEAKISNADNVVVWGSGTPMREFLYSEDMADACILLMNLPDDKYQTLLGLDNDNLRPPVVNVGCGEDVTIRELAEMIKSIVGYKGCLVFDSNMPDGTMRKLMDVARLKSLGWEPKINLDAGINLVYQEFCNSYS